MLFPYLTGRNLLKCQKYDIKNGIRLVHILHAYVLYVQKVVTHLYSNLNYVKWGTTSWKDSKHKLMN